MERIGLVACCGRKRDGAHRAGELYQSDLFLKSRQWVITRCDRWLILSALHGVLDPEDRIERYDLSLASMKAHERRAWAARVRQQLQPMSHATLVALAGEHYCMALDGLQVERPLKGMGIGQQLHWLKNQLAQPGR